MIPYCSSEIRLAKESFRGARLAQSALDMALFNVTYFPFMTLSMPKHKLTRALAP